MSGRDKIQLPRQLYPSAMNVSLLVIVINASLSPHNKKKNREQWKKVFAMH